MKPTRLTTLIRPKALLLALGVVLSSSCVTQARYDDATAELKYYQRLYQDLESYQGKLEAEHAALESELAMYRESGAPIEAGLTADIDRRMEELERMADRIGGAPGDVTVLSVEGGWGLRLPDSIVFRSGSSEISADGRELLLRMAKEIGAQPYMRLWVRGHTDSDPVKRPETKQKYPLGNIQLSVDRALQVGDLLRTAGGLAEEKMVVAGFGPNQPLVPNTSPENKQKNRRVEIFILENESAASSDG